MTPSRSQIEGWSAAIEGLSASAESWRGAAKSLEMATDDYVTNMTAPGGSWWAGTGADAAREVAYTDRGVVYSASDLVGELARKADAGADQLLTLQRAALDAIDEAENDEFAVSEDLSVKDRRSYSRREFTLYLEREARAEDHHGFITMRASALASEDSEIGTELNTGASKLAGMIPTDWPQSGGVVQAVDFKTGPQVAWDDKGNPIEVHDGKLPPAPPGKEWHYTVWGWVAEDPLQHCSGAKQFWLFTGALGGTLALPLAGVGAVFGIPAVGGAISELGQCEAPGS